MFAPACIKISTISMLPSKACSCNGVCPFLKQYSRDDLLLSMSAPPCISAFAMRADTAKCRGVLPYRLCSSSSQPAQSKSFRMANALSFFLLAAWCIDCSPMPSLRLISSSLKTYSCCRCAVLNCHQHLCRSMLTLQGCCSFDPAHVRSDNSSNEVQVERPAPESWARLQHCVLFLLSSKRLAY
jgi:hypothetical protein